MKITINGIAPVLPGPAGDDKGAQARNHSGGHGGGSASVQLSTLSARMREIENRLGDARVVDATRVAEIKQAIAEGRFKVNADVVADRLLDTVRELIGSHKA
jgi:negative regulator of flagellin synthesis FlgM